MTEPSYPEFDTEGWQAIRDARLQEWVQDPHAIKFILDFSDACELFDDLIDEDKPITGEHITRVLFNVLTELPVNPFFDTWKQQLIPIIITGINAWLDANEMEKGTTNDRVFSYVLRDWYMELIAFVIYLTRGKDYMRQHSIAIRRFFTHHETLEQYQEKLS